MQELEAPPVLDLRKKLREDLKDAHLTMTDDEARFLVDDYYMFQDMRIRCGGQIRAMSESGEPHSAINSTSMATKDIEDLLKNVLGRYAARFEVGQWMQSICGIGPVISAGLIAYIDIKQCPTAGHIWSYAGLNPRQEWIGKEKAAKLVEGVVPKKGKVKTEDVYLIANKLHRNPDSFLSQVEKLSKKEGVLDRSALINAAARRPWNAQLKALCCFKIGESFVKQQSRKNDFYGKWYAKRKAQEITKNEAGEFESQALEKAKKVGKSTEAYKHYSEGRLPPAHIHARARRWAVQLFLSHLHHVWYNIEFDKNPPKPFVIEHMGHTDYIAPPNWK